MVISSRKPQASRLHTAFCANERCPPSSAKPSLERSSNRRVKEVHHKCIGARVLTGGSHARGQIEVQVPGVKRFMRSHSPRSTIIWSSIWVTSSLPSRTAWRERETRSALPPRMLPGKVGPSMASMAECLVASEVRTTPGQSCAARLLVLTWPWRWRENSNRLPWSSDFMNGEQKQGG